MDAWYRGKLRCYAGGTQMRSRTISVRGSILLETVFDRRAARVAVRLSGMVAKALPCGEVAITSRARVLAQTSAGSQIHAGLRLGTCPRVS